MLLQLTNIIICRLKQLQIKKLPKFGALEVGLALLYSHSTHEESHASGNTDGIIAEVFAQHAFQISRVVIQVAKYPFRVVGTHKGLGQNILFYALSQDGRSEDHTAIVIEQRS